MDMVENEGLLIAQVKARPALYDKTISDYKRSRKKEKDWGEISTIVGADIETCRKRWRSLRDSFAKQYRGRAVGKKRKWAYYDSLEFLIPHLEVREGKYYKPVKRDSSEEADLDPELVESVEQEMTFDDPLTVSNFDDNLTVKTPQRVERKSKRKRLSDTKDEADEHFLLSLLPFFRRMSPKRNAQARIKVQQLLFKMAFSLENSNFSINSPEIVLCSPAYSTDNSSRSQSPTLNNT